MSTSRTIMVLNSASYVAKFKTQHYVDVYSEHGTAFGSGWHDSGSTVTISVTPDTINFGNGTRIAFKSWTGDFSGSSAIANITVDSPKTIRATWGLQYYLSLDSEYGTPQGEGWYSPGQVATVSISSTIDVGNGIRKVFVGWVGDYSSNDNALSIAINRPMSLTAKWKTQHFLKVETPYGKAVGEGWYDEGSTAYARLENTEVEEFFVIIRYFTRWSGDASGDKAVSDAIYIDAPKTAIAVWGWKPNPLVVNIGILAICIVVASILLTRVPVKQAGVSLVRKTASTLKTAQRIKTKPKAEEEKPKETEKLPPPPPMGKYVVMEALGEGAFSIVYKAREENTGRLVALKVPKKSKEAEELFMKEVNRLEELGGKIRHENIVETYDFGLRPEPYIAMELCDSNIKEAKLSDDERLEVMLEVADALIYAHGKGIVHGDIKPSNILIRGGIPKIGDWGFAYTPEYAAPEIFKGEEPDERSDIWSFGVTFYELLKGFNPFSGKDVFEILEKMEREVDFSGLGRFESVIRKCLSVDNRYNSFEEVKKDLAGLKKASRTIGKDMMLYAFDSLCTSISSDNVEEVNREFRMLKEYMLLPGFVTDAMRIIWEIKLKTREEMTYSFLEANYNELLKHLDQYGRAFETDDDIGGVVRRVLAEMKNETVPEKDREAIRRIFCERSLAKLREILITTML
ncbi:MAG: protein kinase [Thermoproteota archaeon]